MVFTSIVLHIIGTAPFELGHVPHHIVLLFLNLADIMWCHLRQSCVTILFNILVLPMTIMAT